MNGMNENAKKAIAEWRAARVVAGDQSERLDPLQKAIQNPKSLRLAINAKCWDCVGAGKDPNPRKMIRECACGSYCPLFPVRPYQEKESQSQND